MTIFYFYAIISKLNLDYADYKTINAHKGFTIGFNSDVVLVNDLEVELLKKIKNYLEKAKGVLVIYSINKDKNISDIITIMEKLNNITMTKDVYLQDGGYRTNSYYE